MEFITGMEQRGIEKGKREGRREGERAALLNLLEEQFPNIPSEVYQAKLAAAAVDADTLLKWIRRVLKAKSLEDVFEEKH